MRSSPGERLFRIFISSTFDDFVAEREMLRTKVFEPMSRILETRGFTLQPVDLRWGISEEAAFGHETLRICLEQISLCQQHSPRPNFIILAGDRYGWCPPPTIMPEADFDILCEALDTSGRDVLRTWYIKDINSKPISVVLRRREGRYLDSQYWNIQAAELAKLINQALSLTPTDVIPQEQRSTYQNSATEQEANLGLLKADGAEAHAFAVLRSIENIEELMADDGNRRLLRPYIDWKGEEWDRNAWRRQRRLHDRISTRFGMKVSKRVFNCICQLDQNGITRNHLADSALPDPEKTPGFQPTTMCEAVWCGLWQVLLPEMEARMVAWRRRRSDPGSGHLEAARQQSKRCHGREADLTTLMRKVEAISGQPIVLCGPSGIGKSTLLSMFANKIRIEQPSRKVVVRFIGVNETTADTITLLDGLTAEISEPSTPKEPRGLGDPFSERATAFLRALQAYTFPLLIVLDALDQLPRADIERIIDWLPKYLPTDIQLVVSTTPGPVLESLREFWPPNAFLQLGGLDDSGAEKMLDTVLADSDRRLQPSQRNTILKAFVPPKLPLWLDLAGRQAQRWVSSQEPPALKSNAEGLVVDWFDQVAHNSGPRLVGRVLDFLAASRRGLTESALWDLCSADVGLHQEFLRTAHHIPQEIARQIWSQGIPGGLAELQQTSGTVVSAAIRLVEAQVPLPLTLWIRVREDLAIYLTERESYGLGLIDFHHAAVRRVAEKRISDVRDVHRRMADYFGQRWQQGNSLALDSLARDLALAEKASSLADLLIDPDWLVLMLRHLGIGSLQEAFTWSRYVDLDKSSQRDLDWIADAVMESAHVVTGQRSEGMVGPAAELLPAQLLGRLRGRRGPLIDRCLNGLEKWSGFERSTNIAGPQLYPISPSLPALSKQLQRTISGHARPVFGVLLHPDGRTGVSCDDQSVLVWDRKSGVTRLKNQIFQDGTSLCGLALWPDAESVLVGANDGKFRQFRLATGSLKREWQAHQPGLLQMAGSLGSGKIISVGLDKQVRVWSREQPEVPKHLFQSYERPTVFGIDANQPVAAVGFADGGLAVWDLAAKSQLGAGKVSSCITALLIDAWSGRVWWGTDDGEVGIWAYREARPEIWADRHRAKVTSFAFCNNNRVISVGYDVSIRFWEKFTGEAAESWPAMDDSVHPTPIGHCFRILAVAGASNQPLFATASEDTTIRIWDADTADAAPVRLGHRSIILDTAIDRMHQRVFTVSKDGAIECWDLATGFHHGTLGHHPGDGLEWQPGDPAGPPWLCSRILLAADGQHAITAGAGSICWWDLGTTERGYIRRVQLPSSDSIGDMVWFQGGSLLISIGGQLYAGDPWNGRFDPLNVRGHIRRIALSSDGRTLVLLPWDPLILLGQMVGHKLQSIGFLPQAAQPLAAAFLPDQSSLLVVGHDRNVTLWNIQSGQRLGVIGRHEREIWDVAVSADGKVAATVGDDRWVAVWDIPARKLRACFQSEGPMVRVSLDPAGEYIVTGDEAGRPIILRC